MRTILTILRKDLLLELRGLETLPAMILFAIVTFVIFHFGLNRDTIDGQLAKAFYLGLTPGFVGLYQANFKVPALAAGDHQLAITAGGVASNTPVITVAP